TADIATNYQITAARNATLGNTQNTVTLSVKELTVSTNFTSTTKEYDGTTSINITTSSLTGVVDGESVTATGSGNFDDKNVGTGKTITATYTLSGTDASNYSISSATTTGSITPKALTITGITASNKEYDGNRTAAIDTNAAIKTGLVVGDVLTVSATGTFNDKNVGTAKIVTLSSSYGGDDRNNYTITDQTSATATITKKTLTISGITGQSKVYDATSLASIDVTNITKNGLIPGDIVNVSVTGLFDNENAELNKIVTLQSTYTGSDVTNYSIINQVSTQAEITRAPLTIKAVNSAKFILDPDPISYEVIYVGLKGDDTSSDIASELGITTTRELGESAKGYVLTPNGSDQTTNYNITYLPGNFTIVPADTLLVRVTNQTINYSDPVNYVLTAQYKQFNENNENLVTITNTRINNDRVEVNDNAGGIASFTIAPHGRGIKSASNNYKVGGYDLEAIQNDIVGNNFNSMVLVGALTVNPKIIQANDIVAQVSKTYDGNSNITRENVTITPASNSFVSGDNISIYGLGSYSDPNVNTNKRVTLNVFLEGRDSSNYAINSNVNDQSVGVISQLASVSYTGGVSGNWSNPSNWTNGAIPVASNVAEVIIPSGKTVVFDYSNLSGKIQNSGDIKGSNNDNEMDIAPTSVIRLEGNSIIDINNNENLALSNNISGTGSVMLSGNGTTTIVSANTYSGGTNIQASHLTLGHANAIGTGVLSSNGGTLSAAGVTLPSLIVNGAITLDTNIFTTGNQTYNGPVKIIGGSVAHPLEIKTQNADIIFNSTINGTSSSYTNQNSLKVNAGTADVTFNGAIGANLDNVLFSPDTLKISTNLYQLNVYANTININGDVITFERQIYNGDVIIGGDQATPRYLISEDPEIIFNGSLDGAIADVYNLNLFAITTDSAITPKVTFDGNVGLIKALKSLTVKLGIQADQANDYFYRLTADKIYNDDGYKGLLTFKEGTKVITLLDQVYKAASVSDEVKRVEFITGSEGKVNFITGIDTSNTYPNFGRNDLKITPNYIPLGDGPGAGNNNGTNAPSAINDNYIRFIGS
ncbi:hypothetical protein EB001_19135, partial [bacterium]|nr:hypothetical protein [bacterium]